MDVRLIGVGALLIACLSAPAVSADDVHAQGVVTGIGGVFFRAEDPARLQAWYAEHLGIAPPPSSYDSEPWRQEAGYTVFAAFPADTEYFGDTGKAWMINFRVRDLAALVAALRAKGIEVSDPESYPNGSFARLLDPEGNPVELWQPASPQS